MGPESQWHMRQAQITLFIILGLVLLLAVAIAVYVLSSQEGGDQGVRSSTIRQEVIKPVERYVTECLSLVSNAGMLLLAEQGGTITRSQGGISPDFLPDQEGERYVLTDEGANVTYLLRTDPSFTMALETAPFISSSPTLERHSQLVYPYMTFPFNPIQPVPQFSMSGLFGWNRIQPLEHGNDTPESWQETLEAYVSANVQRCVNWELLAGTRRIIAPDEPAVRVSFGRSDTTFRMAWPIVATEISTGATATVKDFSVTQPVRLASIYQSIRSMLDKDASELLYRVKAEPGVRVQHVTRDGKSHGSLVHLTDTLSSVGDERYVMTFARHNRPPALLAINQTLLDQPDAFLGDCRDTIIGFSQGARDCPDAEARLGSNGCQTPSGPAPGCADDSLQCRGLALARDLGQDSTAFALTIRGGVHGDGEPCGIDIRLPLFAVDPDEQSVLFQFDFPPNVQGGYRVTTDDLARRCLGVKAVATDGTAKDWQVARIWTSGRDEASCSFFTIN